MKIEQPKSKYEFEITDPLILEAFQKWDADDNNPVGVPENLAGYESTFEAGFRAGWESANIDAAYNSERLLVPPTAPPAEPKCECGHSYRDHYEVSKEPSFCLGIPNNGCGCQGYTPTTEPNAMERARAWLEANTPLRWVDEPDSECPDEPLEAFNRRPQIYAERMTAFLESETPRIKADAVREFIAEVEKEIVEPSGDDLFDVHQLLTTGSVLEVMQTVQARQVAKEMTEVD